MVAEKIPAAAGLHSDSDTLYSFDELKLLTKQQNNKDNSKSLAGRKWFLLVIVSVLLVFFLTFRVSSGLDVIDPL